MINIVEISSVSSNDKHLEPDLLKFFLPTFFGFSFGEHNITIDPRKGKIFLM